MKIINKRKEHEKFEQIKEGTVFIHDNEVYMKTFSTYCDDCGDYDNAVNLNNGELSFFCEDELILVVNAELIIT